MEKLWRAKISVIIRALGSVPLIDPTTSKIISEIFVKKRAVLENANTMVALNEVEQFM